MWLINGSMGKGKMGLVYYTRGRRLLRKGRTIIVAQAFAPPSNLSLHIR
jgi:hypothetical protein